MESAPRFRWRFIVTVTLGVGIAVGLGIAMLQTYFGIEVPTILGGLLSGLIIVVILALSKSPTR
jgi:hypothetical protein